MGRINPIFVYLAKMVGEKAQQLLGQPEFRGNTVAVFSSATYLKGENGEIFWITGGEIPLHRRALTISYTPEIFSPEENFYLPSANLQVGRNIFIIMDQVSLWRPPALVSGKIPSPAELTNIFQNWPPSLLEIDPPWRHISNRFFYRLLLRPSKR